jgi:capsular polysaccharide biosynthesis protein
MLNMTKNIHLFKDKCNICKQLFEKDENGREITIYKTDNCFATGISLYYPNVLLNYNNNSLVLPLLERTMSLGTGTIYERSGMTFTTKNNDITNCNDIENGDNDIKNCENTPIFFFIYNTDNYFHFLYDTLPYLISYMDLKKTIPNLKLLMQYPNEQRSTFYPFVLELLELIDIHKDDIIIVNSNTIYKEMYISTSYTHDIDSNLPPRKEIYSFYKIFVDNASNMYKNQQQSQPHQETPKKIYVSRRTWLHNDFNNIGTNYTTKRRMVNEDEYVDYLIKKGYKEVLTEKLTTIEKILYFSNATHVIGAIGGGISNVLFSHKTTKLEVIVSPTFLDVNKRFKYSLECVDDVYYNMNTSHVETDEFKMYMRVKTKDIIGEIERIDGDNLIISYTDGTNTGWNSQCKYKQITLSKNEVERLDNGLNSLWKLDSF